MEEQDVMEEKGPLWYFNDLLKDIEEGNPKTLKRELEDLREVGKLHYIHINQIFGDAYLRNQVIQKIGILWDDGSFRTAPTEYYIHDEPADDSQFDNGDHLYLTSKTQPDKRVCSVDSCYQLTSINKQDTLCQSYSLLAAYGLLDGRHTPYPKTKKNPETQRQEEIDWKKRSSQTRKQKIAHIMVQKDMIKMYREIVNNPAFKVILADTIRLRASEGITWIKDITRDQKKIRYTKSKFKVNLAPIIVDEINKLLDSWDEYGYMWFTGDPEKDLGVEEDSETELDSEIELASPKKESSYTRRLFVRKKDEMFKSRKN